MALVLALAWLCRLWFFCWWIFEIGDSADTQLRLAHGEAAHVALSVGDCNEGGGVDSDGVEYEVLGGFRCSPGRRG